MPLPPAFPARRRRTAIGGLLVAAFTVALSGSAFGAVAITSATGQNADPTQSAPANNRTEQRSLTIAFTAAAGAGDYALDGAAPTTQTYAAGANTITLAGPLSLGTHKIVITDSAGAGGSATYIWRIEPPQYGPLVRNEGTTYAYWPLDDSVSSLLADDAHTAGYDGDYKNFVVKQQSGAPKCEEQPGAPHSPWACDWAGPGTDTPSPFYTSIDPVTNSPATGGGRDAKGTSAYFGGKDDHIQIEGMPNPGSPEWTIEGWVKPNFAEQTRGIFQHVPSLWAKPGAAGFNQFACSGLNDEPNAVFSTPVANANWTGKWFYVACTFSSGMYRLYVNGVLEATSSTPTTWSSPTTGAYQGYIGWVDKIGSWWSGWVDDVGYYRSALSADTVSWHYQTGAIQDTDYHPSFITTATEDVAPPSRSAIASPNGNAQYSPEARSFKAPKLDFSCTDVAGTGSTTFVTGTDAGTANVADTGGDCFAEYSADGTTWTPIANGANLPGVSPIVSGDHFIRISAMDNGNNLYQHTHRYYVHGDNPGFGFRDLIKCTTVPVALTPSLGCSGPVAYYRLDEAANALVMTDSSGNGKNGEYKNDASGTATGISGGAANASRRFFGVNGYAYANAIDEPQWGYTMELFVKPAFGDDMMLMQHGGSGALYIKNNKVVFRPEERSPATVTAANVTIAAGTWYYVAATYDGVTARLHVIRSPQTGVAVTLPSTFSSTDGFVLNDWERISSTAVHYQPSGSDTLYLGYGDQLGGGSWLKGDLDEAAYYATAMSSSKLSEHYYADPPSKLGASLRSKGKLKAKAKAKTKAKAEARAKAKAKARAKAKAKARAKAKAKARAKAKAKARAKAKRKPR